MNDEEDKIRFEQPMPSFYMKYEGLAPKMVISFGENGEHLTFVYKNQQRTIDVHLKKGEEYDSYFEMKVTDFYRLMERMATSIAKLTVQYWFQSKMNLGRMVKYGFFLVPIDGKGYDQTEILRINKNKTRFKFRKEVSKGLIEKMYMSPDEAYESNSNVLFIYKWKKNHLRWEGMAFREEGRTAKSFWFLKKSKFLKFNKDVLFIFRDGLNKEEFKHKTKLMRLLENLIQEKYPDMDTEKYQETFMSSLNSSDLDDLIEKVSRDHDKRINRSKSKK